MGTFINLAGQRFGRLTVKKATDQRKNSSVVWLCDCECGNKNILASSKELRNEIKQSCGCLQRERQSESGQKTKNLKTRQGEENHKVRFDSKSGIKNVEKAILKNGDIRYRAYFTKDRKKHYLGSFENAADAVKAVEDAKNSLPKN